MHQFYPKINTIFSSDISGGALRLLGHPAFTSSTTFKTIFTAIES
jgi:hypothetical protein